MNKENAGRFKVCHALVLISVTLISTVDSALALDVHSIWVKTEKDHRAGTPEIGPFDMVAGVFGDNITSVQVTSPAGITETLDPEAGAWYWDMEEKYATLEDLHQDFPIGFYEFTFNQGEATEDSVTVWIDPEQPTGLANITYPADGNTDVPLIPTFTWDSCLGYGDSLHVNVGDIETDTDLYVDGLNIGAVSWTPGPTVAGRLCEFQVRVQIASPIQLLTTGKGDPLTCSDVFSWSNEVRFITAGPRIIDVVAHTISPKTKRITCHIWPPEGYDVADINPDSIRLNWEIPAVKTVVTRKQQMLVAQFLAAELGLEPSPGLLALTVSGELVDETPFTGSDFVTLVEKGGGKP